MEDLIRTSLRCVRKLNTTPNVLTDIRIKLSHLADHENQTHRRDTWLAYDEALSLGVVDPPVLLPRLGVHDYPVIHDTAIKYAGLYQDERPFWIEVSGLSEVQRVLF